MCHESIHSVSPTDTMDTEKGNPKHKDPNRQLCQRIKTGLCVIKSAISSLSVAPRDIAISFCVPQNKTHFPLRSRKILFSS
jgi:hypothetical protein